MLPHFVVGVVVVGVRLCLVVDIVARVVVNAAGAVVVVVVVADFAVGLLVVGAGVVFAVVVGHHTWVCHISAY